MMKIRLEDVLAAMFVTAFSFGFICLGIALIIAAINGGV